MNTTARYPLVILLALLLTGCADGGFRDEDYVRLTVELTLLGTKQSVGGAIPADPALRAEWRKEQVGKLLDGYGLTEDEYIAYSLALHEDPERYSRVLNDIALELEEWNQSLIDEEAPEEVKPPPGSFG